jgi:hypothetical protein
MLFFDIINIHLITLESLLESFFHLVSYLIYCIIKIHTYKHLKIGVFSNIK